jgi:hypothetical protein
MRLALTVGHTHLLTYTPFDGNKTFLCIYITAGDLCDILLTNHIMAVSEHFPDNKFLCCQGNIRRMS